MTVKNKRALMENKRHQTVFRVPITKVQLRLDYIYISQEKRVDIDHQAGVCTSVDARKCSVETISCSRNNFQALSV